MERQDGRELLEPSVVEDLIKEKRIPIVHTIKAGGTKEGVVYVPPKGMEKGDTLRGSPMFGYKWIAHDGTEKGSAAMFILSSEETEKLREKIESLSLNKNSEKTKIESIY